MVSSEAGCNELMRVLLDREEYRFSDKELEAINFDEKNVRELKPDTPSGIAKGNSRLAKYVVQLEEQTRETWTGFLDTYTLKKSEI